MGEFSERLREALHKRSMKQADLSRETGIDRASVCNYLKGSYKPNTANLYRMAAVLNVSESWLLGYDVPMVAMDVHPVLGQKSKIPLLGKIVNGQPIICDDHIDQMIDTPTEISNVDFALRCKGNSMINARIYDGDIVYIRQQDDVDDGQIAAVMVPDYGGEGGTALKRVYHSPDGLILQPENHAYKTIVSKDARIFGLAVGFTSILN